MSNWFIITLLYFSFGNIKAPLHYGKTVFHELDKAHNVLLEYFVISIPLFNDVIKDKLDEWLHMMKHSEVKEDFKFPYMKKLAERLNFLTMTPAERNIPLTVMNR